jgi:putative modified peptide
MQPKPPQITLSRPAETHDLARKLATDDAFRARFQQNPQKVLAEFNIAIPDAQMPATVSLPSKEKFVEGIMALTGHDPRTLDPAAAAALGDAHWAFLAFLAFL